MTSRLVVAAAALLGLGACALLPLRQTECSAAAPCPAGLRCSAETSTCVPAPGPEGAMDLAAAPDLGEAPCIVGTAGCAPCRLHGDCASLACDLYQQTSQGSGRCLPAGAVLYVDNRNGTCDRGMGGDGSSPQAAVCTLTEGLGLLDSTRRALRVLPSSRDYGPLAIIGRAVALYGPAGEGGKAQLGDTAGVDGVTLAGEADVILDGFEIAKGRVGLRCAGVGAARVQLRRSQIIDAADLGVLVTGCALRIDRALLLGSGNGALAVGGAEPYAITNSFIVKSRSSALPAIKIASSGPGEFRFNTVVENSSMLAAAMDCGGQALRIEDSIFLRNQRVAGSQFQGGCQLDNTAVGMPDSAPGTSIAMTPELGKVGGVDYGLNPNGMNAKACCIDRARGAIALDYFGTERPLGEADIGAHEAR